MISHKSKDILRESQKVQIERHVQKTVKRKTFGLCTSILVMVLSFIIMAFIFRSAFYVVF